MKKIILKIFLVTMLTALSLAYAYAQPLPGNGDDGDPIRPAPIGSGWVILLGLAGAYSATKLWKARSSQNREK